MRSEDTKHLEEVMFEWKEERQLVGRMFGVGCLRPTVWLDFSSSFFKECALVFYLHVCVRV